MNPMIASKIVADKYNMIILSKCFEKPLSAQYMAQKFDIPIAACYRKIMALQKTGLLKVVDIVLTNQGKRVKLYQSIVKEIKVIFRDGKLHAKFDIIPLEERDMNSFRINFEKKKDPQYKINVVPKASTDDMWNVVDVVKC